MHLLQSLRLLLLFRLLQPLRRSDAPTRIDGLQPAHWDASDYSLACKRWSVLFYGVDTHHTAFTRRDATTMRDAFNSADDLNCNRPSPCIFMYHDPDNVPPTYGG